MLDGMKEQLLVIEMEGAMVLWLENGREIL